MNINTLVIKNFKSIAELEIFNANPFSVFIGANASGKSNIIEALQFAHHSIRDQDYAVKTFGGIPEINNFKNPNALFQFEFRLNDFEMILKKESEFTDDIIKTQNFVSSLGQSDYSFFLNAFTRLSLCSTKPPPVTYQDDKKLSNNANNLEKVLRRVLRREKVRNNINEWLQLLVQEFKSVEVLADDLTGANKIQVEEYYSPIAFSKKLISDGTFNIIAMLTAIYQSDEPQFLCIEEPENGLNPKVVKELVNFFREQCETNNHLIWVTTHSQTFVSCLRKEEVIIVDKRQGETKIKQVHDTNLYDLKLDEAWLSNVFGGGIPW